MLSSIANADACIFAGSYVKCLASGGINLDNNKSLLLSELASNGTNYIALKSPASLVSNFTFTMPDNDGSSSGQALTTDGAGILSWTTVTPAIGGELIGSTQGSVLFVGTGNFQQDNSKFFFDDTNDRLAIGTNTPSAALEIESGANALAASFLNGDVTIENGTHQFTAEIVPLSAQGLQTANLDQVNLDFPAATTITGTTVAPHLTLTSPVLNNTSNLTVGVGELGVTGDVSLFSPTGTATAGTIDAASGKISLFSPDAASLGGTIADFTFYNAVDENAGGVFTVTNGYGFRLNEIGGGNVTNLWGVYIEPAAAKNYFAGSVGIGTNAPNGTLEVVTDSGAPIIFSGTEYFEWLGDQGFYVTPTANTATGAYMSLTSANTGVVLDLFKDGGVGQALRIQAVTTSPAADFSQGGTGAALLLKGSGTGPRLQMAGSTSGTVGITAAAAAGTWALTLPVNDGDSGQALTTNGSGVTSWVTPTLPSIGGTLTGGTAGSVLFVDPTETFAQENANFFWDNANNRLGIGTSSPGEILDIQRNFDGQVAMAIANPNAGTSAYTSIETRNGSTVNESMRIGTLGTGWTTTGGYVQDGGFLTAQTNLSGGMSIITEASAPIRLYTNGNSNERMRIESSGNVGIGTSVPAARLSVAGDGASLIHMGSVGFSNYVAVSLNGSTLTSSNYNFLSGSSDADLYINRPASNSIIFREANGAAEHLRIASGGNIGIGSASPGQRLTVEGTFGILEGGGSPTFHTIFQGGNQAGDVTYTLPINDGSASQVLTTDGSGVLSWATGASGPTIFGSASSPELVTAAGGVVHGGATQETHFIAGNGGAVTISANPQISGCAGGTVGYEIKLIGEHNTNTVTLTDGTGIKINGATIALAANSFISFVCDGSIWVEMNRNGL